MLDNLQPKQEETLNRRLTEKNRDMPDKLTIAVHNIHNIGENSSILQESQRKQDLAAGRVPHC